MGKLRCERIVSNDPKFGERVFVLSNGENIRVKQDPFGWRSVESRQTYRSLDDIRRLVRDFEDKWKRRIPPTTTARPSLRTSLTGMGTEAQTVWLQDGWEEKRADPKPPTPSHRLDVSRTANFSVPLCSPHEAAQKIASGNEARRIIDAYHESPEHQAEGGCNTCQ